MFGPEQHAVAADVGVDDRRQRPVRRRARRPAGRSPVVPRSSRGRPACPAGRPAPGRSARVMAGVCTSASNHGQSSRALRADHAPARRRHQQGLDHLDVAQSAADLELQVASRAGSARSPADCAADPRGPRPDPPRAATRPRPARTAGPPRPDRSSSRSAGCSRPAAAERTCRHADRSREEYPSTV